MPTTWTQASTISIERCTGRSVFCTTSFDFRAAACSTRRTRGCCGTRRRRRTQMGAATRRSGRLASRRCCFAPGAQRCRPHHADLHYAVAARTRTGADDAGALCARGCEARGASTLAYGDRGQPAGAPSCMSETDLRRCIASKPWSVTRMSRRDRAGRGSSVSTFVSFTDGPNERASVGICSLG